MNRVLILTNKNSISGKSLINESIKEKLDIEEVILLEQNLLYYFRLFRFVLKRVGLLETIIFSIVKLVSEFIHEIFFYNSLNMDQLIKKNNLNFKSFKNEKNWQLKLSNYIDKKESKIILIGQTGILGQEFNLFRKDRLFINCHPGDLPQYRGLDSFKWAIFENKLNSLKISIHIVREKIDSGEILHKEKYDFKEISWFFSDRQLLIISGKKLARYIKKISAQNCLRENILKIAKNQEYKKLRFKMNLNKEIKTYFLFKSLKKLITNNTFRKDL